MARVFSCNINWQVSTVYCWLLRNSPILNDSVMATHSLISWPLCGRGLEMRLGSYSDCVVGIHLMVEGDQAEFVLCSELLHHKLKCLLQ